MRKYQRWLTGLMLFGILWTAGLPKASAASWFPGAIFNGVLNEGQDRDAETGFNPTTFAQLTGTPNTLSSGDLFGGILQLSTITNQSNGNFNNVAPGNSAGFSEATAMFLAVVTKSGSAGDFTFTFTPASQAAWTGVFGAPAAGIAAGTMVRFMSDPSQDFNRNTSPLSTSIGTATNGTFVGDLGFKNGTSPGAGEGWEALHVPSDDLNFFKTISGNSGTTVNIGVNRLAGFAGFNFANLPDVFGSPGAQFTGNGSVIGISGINTPWSAFSQVNFNFQPPAVPEPTSCVLLGLGMFSLGIGAYRRRKSVRA